MTGSADLWFYVVQTVMALILFRCGYWVAVLRRPAPPRVDFALDLLERQRIADMIRDVRDIERVFVSSMPIQDDIPGVAAARMAYRTGRDDGIELALALVEDRGIDPAGLGPIRFSLQQVKSDLPTTDDEETKHDD